MVKNQTGLDSLTYIHLPYMLCSPTFYGLPKIHRPDTLLRPIVSSCGSVTFGVAKELAKILKPLVGKSPHHINSTHDLVEQIKQLTLAPGKCLSSYYVSALFMSVPVDPALGVMKDLLEKTPPSRIEQYIQLMTLFNYWNSILKNELFIPRPVL